MKTFISFDNFIEKVKLLARKSGIMNKNLEVEVGKLTPEEAIGSPLRDDFPLLKGKEFLIEAKIESVRGQAFTAYPAPFKGTIEEALNLPDTPFATSIKVAVANAVLRYLGYVDKTIHCKDETPSKCARELIHFLKSKGYSTVSLVGLQPAFASELLSAFGKNRVLIFDLDEGNIKKGFEGCEVFGPDKYNLLSTSDVVLATGSTVTNKTLWEISKHINGDFYLYGVTARAYAFIAGIPEFCKFGG